MNATYSFLASDLPSLYNGSVYVHEMEFRVWDGSRPRGHLFLALEVREVPGLPRCFSLNIQNLPLNVLSDVALIQRIGSPR